MFTIIVKKPLEFVSNKINYITSNSEFKELPNKSLNENKD